MSSEIGGNNSVIDDADILIANALNQIDANLEQLALHIASGAEEDANGDVTGGVEDAPEDFNFGDLWTDGELGSGDLYAVSVYTSEQETASKVYNKAGFSDEENLKNNADMSIQR